MRLRTSSLVLAMLLGTQVGCGRKDGAPLPDTQMADPPEREVLPTAHSLQIPEDYHGPIDPKWPPTHPANLAIELEAGRILKETIKNGHAVPKAPLLEGDHPDVHAEQGRIGGFDYIEVVLGPRAHPEERMPLVVLLHGRGGRPSIPHGPFATKKPLRLFIPRGPDQLGSGYNWLATWTNSGQTELLGRSLAARVDQLMPAIEAFERLRPTTGKPVVVGFSQGGILTLGLAIRYPEQFRAAFPIAGWLPPAMIPTKRKAGVVYPFIHAFHGSADHTVPTEKGRETVEALRRLGVRVKYSEFEGVGHVVSEAVNRQVRHALRLVFQAE